MQVVLTGDQGYQAVTTSKVDGSYRFIGVPAGVYTLDLPDYQVREGNITPTPGEDLIIDLVLPIPGETITVEIRRGTGLPLIVGRRATV